MLRIRTFLLGFFVFGGGLLMQHCQLKNIEIEDKQSSDNFFAYKKIIEAKVKIVMDEVQKRAPTTLVGGRRRILPVGLKSRIYLDTSSSPALMRYTATGEEVRLFGLNYQLPQGPEAVNKINDDLNKFKELGIGILRVSITENQPAQADTLGQILHTFLKMADERDLYVHLAFTQPQIQIATWLNFRDAFDKAIIHHRNIALIEVPEFTFPGDTANPDKVIAEAKEYYKNVFASIRKEGVDNLIATPLPTFKGPHAEKFQQALNDSPIQVITVTKKFATAENLKITPEESLAVFTNKGKSVHWLEWKLNPSPVMLTGMVQKWREMGVQTAACLPPEIIQEIPQYKNFNPQIILTLQAAALAFHATTDENKKTETLSQDDVIKGPWSAISKSKNAMIFRNTTSVLFVGLESQWQPFNDLPQILTDVSCVGDCPYWRATFSNLDTNNHPGLITLRKVQAESGRTAYVLKIQPWIQVRGPASVLQEGWVVFSFKPSFPDFQNLSQKIVEYKNPVTHNWEKYKIGDKDYSLIGTKNAATGLPYIVVQSGGEYRISEKLPEAFTSKK